MSLAIDYRPAAFDEVAGNKATVQAINAILSRDRKDIPHSLMFTGPSGCGKTTLARIVAERLGCKGADLSEVDAADFRGIDTIRAIRQQMHFKPMESACRVYILDECHAMSKDAMNALLKALEDTPSHVYFMLATTDPQKLLPTIKNRCVQFTVEPLGEKDMAEFLREVVTAERKRVPPDVIKLIAQDSLGSCRTALQVLEKVIDLPPEDMKAAAEQVAAVENQVIDLCRALMGRAKWSVVAKILKGLEGEEPEGVRRAVMGYCASVLLNGDAPQAFVVMDCFRGNLFDNGRAGLTMYAYEALEAGKG